MPRQPVRPLAGLAAVASLPAGGAQLEARHVGGAAVGAGLMYFFDPRMGRRRRAILRDQGVHYRKVARRAAGRKLRDLKNRGRGAVYHLRHAG
jgi:hypothetical protein